MSKYSDQFIDDYLFNKLSPNEHSDFEKEINMNEEIKNQVALRSIIIKGVKSIGRDNLKNRLKVIHQKEVAKPAPKIRSILPAWLTIAASVAILLVAGYFLMDKDSENALAIYDKNYSPYELSFATRSINENEDLKTISQVYNAGAYEATLVLIEKHFQSNKVNSRLLLAAGICHLELGDASKARTYFSKIIEAKDFRFTNQAMWYEAMSYLKEEDLNATKKILKMLSENEGDKSTEASQLLERLK